MSKLSENRNAIKEQADALRVKQNIDNAPVDENDVTLKPVGFAANVKNIWYLFKLPIILILAAVIVITSIIIAVFTPKKYDATLTFISSQNIDGAAGILKPELEKYLEDYNNDSKVDLKMDFLSLLYEDTSGKTTLKTLESVQAKIVVEVSSSKKYLFLLDNDTYSQLKDIGAQFTALSDIVKSDRVQGDKYILKGSNLAKDLNFSDTLGDCFFCVLDYNSFDKKIKEKPEIKEAYQNDVKFFEKLVSID